MAPTDIAIIVEITIVAGGCHADVCHGEYLLQLLLCPFVIGVGFCDTDVPRLAFAVLTFSYHFAADVHEVVLAAFVVQQLRDDVTGLPFRHSSTVNLNPRV